MTRVQSFGFVLAIMAYWSLLPGAFAQTLLERFSQQLNEGLQRETLPAPRAQPLPGTPSLGIRVAPLTDDSVRANRLTVRRGALITAIEQGSAAERAGLPLGGAIVAVNGRRVDSPEDLVQAIRATAVGQTVELTYYERDKLVRKKIQMAAAEAPRLLVAPENPQPIPPPPSDVTATPPPNPASPPSAQPLAPGAPGARPLLGRIGRLLEGVVPAQATDSPLLGPPTATAPVAEVTVLRQQVEELRRQVEVLQRQVESLEKRLAERK
jgi:membrane-associated protease RseP (regulator of RpoE activity)